MIAFPRFLTQPLVAAALALAFTAAAAAKPPAAPRSPRERLLMDFGWAFQLGDPADAGKNFDYPELDDLAKARLDDDTKEAALAASRPDPVATNLGGKVSTIQEAFDDSRWRRVDLPHDWVVELG